MKFLRFLLLIKFIAFVINSKEDYEQNTKLGNFYQIDDYIDKDLVFNYSSNNKWLLIFYDKKCPYSRGALINLKRDILKYFYPNKKLKFGIIDVERQETNQLKNRFKVKKVPYTILINKDKMYSFSEIFTPRKIIDFIEKLNISNYKPVPEDPYKFIYEKPLSFYEQSKKNFYEYINSLNQPMQNFLDNYYINIKWTNKKTYFSFLIFIILLIPTEYFLIINILYCLGFIVKEKIKQKLDNENDIKIKNEKYKTESLLKEYKYQTNINKEKSD